MTDLAVALGLMLAIEGILFASFPGVARRAAENLLTTPAGALRVVGLVLAALGVAVIWLVRG